MAHPASLPRQRVIEEPHIAANPGADRPRRLPRADSAWGSSTRLLIPRIGDAPSCLRLGGGIVARLRDIRLLGAIGLARLVGLGGWIGRARG